MRHRKHIVATLLIGLLWSLGIVLVGYLSWEAGSPYYDRSLDDPFVVGFVLVLSALVLTYTLLRSTFARESVRAARWRKLADMIDEMDERDFDLLQAQLSRPVNNLYEEEALTVGELLQEQKRKREHLMDR